MASLSIITLPGWGNVLSEVYSEYGSFFPGGGVASQGYFTRRRNPIRNWTLAFFPVSCWLTQKALQDRKIVTHLRCLLAGSLQEGARMLVAVLTDDIGERMHVLLCVGMVQAPLQKY